MVFFYFSSVHDKDFFLGLKEDLTTGQWLWEDGEEILTTSSLWNVNQPSNTHGNEDCGGTSDQTFRLNDFQCDRDYGYMLAVCEKQHRHFIRKIDIFLFFQTEQKSNETHLVSRKQNISLQFLNIPCKLTYVGPSIQPFQICYIFLKQFSCIFFKSGKIYFCVIKTQ